MSYSELNFMLLLQLKNKSFMVNPLDYTVSYSLVPHRYYF